MMGYVTLGTSDLGRAAGCHDALLAEIGAARGMASDGFVAPSTGPASAAPSMIQPPDGNERRVFDVARG